MVERLLRSSRLPIESALLDTPVLSIHGARQSGKSALAQAVAALHGHHYLTFDEGRHPAAAREDPIGFVERLDERVVLDEVQRVPELILPLKAKIDRDRHPGRFILTGSADWLRMPALSDSLAGRVEALRLGPLAQLEIEGHASGNTLLDRLFAQAPLIGSGSPRRGGSPIRRLLAGGFPSALFSNKDFRYMVEHARLRSAFPL